MSRVFFLETIVIQWTLLGAREYYYGCKLIPIGNEFQNLVHSLKTAFLCMLFFSILRLCDAYASMLSYIESLSSY